MLSNPHAPVRVTDARLSVFVAFALSIVLAIGSGTSAAQRTATHDSTLSNLRVGYMTSVPVTSGSWDPALFRLISGVGKENKWRVDLAEAVAPAQAAQVLGRFGSQKANLVFVTSQLFERSVIEAAKKYPETRFVMMADLSSTEGLPNVAAYAPDWYEFGYLGGAAAALVSTSGKIGLISGLPITPNLKAFGSAKFGAERFNKAAQTYVTFTNTFVDAAKGREAAEALIARGVDVTFSIGGGMVPGIMEAAITNKTFVVGAYADESHFAPKNVPTSVVIEWSTAMNDLTRQLTEGTFRPQVVLLTVKNGGLRVLPFKTTPNAERDSASMAELIELIKSGKVKVPEVSISK